MHTGLLMFFAFIVALFSSGISYPSLRQTDPPLPSLDAWSLIDPSDPQLPTLIDKHGETYQLDKTWKIKSIEYLYQWWGLGKPVFDYQSLSRNGQKFLNGKTEVETTNVQAFIDSINDLHSTQFLLAGSSHTDDYPSWNIQITGEDGNSIQLFASSNGNPGGAPWNILYNGRMYVQYTGALAEPLSKLFTSQRGQPAAAFFPGGDIPGMITFNTEGYPRQLTEGFTGLLPIADSFQYSVDTEKNTIDGIIKGRESIGGFGTMVIGSITELVSVNLTLSDASTTKCTINDLPSTDPAGAAWSFSCALPTQTKDQTYKLPIAVTFATDSKEEITINGELHGRWDSQPDIFLVPADEQIRNLLVDNSHANDLLKDHVLAYATYGAQVDPNNINKGKLSGQAIFIGQTKLDEQTIRYTIATPFSIEDGKLTQWELDRSAVDKLLAETTQSPITRRAVQADKNLILNLAYAEAKDQPEIGDMNSSSSQFGQTAIGSCSGPASVKVPSEGKPLEAFSFNSGWTVGRSDFIIVDGQVMVNDVDLDPINNDRGDVLSALLPDVFNNDASKTIARIWMTNQGIFGGKPTLTLWLPRDATKAQRETYQQIAKSIGGSLDQQYETLWEIKGINFVVSDEGKIEIKTC